MWTGDPQAHCPRAYGTQALWPAGVSPAGPRARVGPVNRGPLGKDADWIPERAVPLDCPRSPPLNCPLHSHMAHAGAKRRPMAPRAWPCGGLACDGRPGRATHHRKPVSREMSRAQIPPLVGRPGPTTQTDPGEP